MFGSLILPKTAPRSRDLPTISGKQGRNADSNDEREISGLALPKVALASPTL